MTTPDNMTFETSLDLLIATSITCLRNDNRKLRRAIEIAISYRALSPTSEPAISSQELELLGAWLIPPTAVFMRAAAEADERDLIENQKRRIGQ
jgi:hypothetical protein